MTSITIHDERGDVTIPVGPVDVASLGLDYQAGDIQFSGQVRIGVGVAVTIVLKHDGSWVHFTTKWGKTDNIYLHFATDSLWDRTHRRPPTETQRATIARWRAGRERPYGLSVGGPVYGWAFQGLTEAEVDAMCGRKIAMTAPCDDREQIGAAADRDDSQDREHLLEQAVESGQISGAAAAD